MSGTHEKKHHKDHVKSNIEIAMEKAAAAAPGVNPQGQKPPQPPPSDAELAALREKAAKADEYYNRLLRTTADLENYKKRVERERSDLLKFAHEELMAELITVLDNFERALAAAHTVKDVAGVTEGINLIHKQLLDVLRKFGLSPIAAIGQPFNPQLHEAIAQKESDAHPEGTVMAEHLKGYTLDTRLLRPAAVTVATKKASPAADAPKA
ncbi:MAG: nucleotide exchange factor GrpE [Candidatus Aureabacteria bacterium]|nr:nucleotide exchange factor GrpE [Candidatus Auribacterota bacterium]